MAPMLRQCLLTGFALVLLLELSFSLAHLQLIGSGIVTFRKGRLVPSTCYGRHDKGHLTAYVREDYFDRGKVCGQKYKITCWKCDGIKSVDVTITGKCIDTKHYECGDFALSEYAFSHLLDPAKHKTVNVTFVKIP